MKEEYKELKELQKRYLTRLSDLYPTIAAASTEIINLQAILNLPKGTEHFLTDVHGEYEAFSHVLKNGSGSVRRKIEDVFGNTMSAADKKSLATLIYYPRAKMDLIRQTETNMEDWSISFDRSCQKSGEQVYAVESKKGASPKFCLCDRGTDHGESGGT